jgi:FAD linked oxidases, C-terminal domain
MARLPCSAATRPPARLRPPGRVRRVGGHARDCHGDYHAASGPSGGGADGRGRLVDHRAGGDAVTAIVASGIVPAAVEMMDKLAIEAGRGRRRSRVDPGVAAALIVELDGPADEVDAQFARVQQVCRAHPGPLAGLPERVRPGLPSFSLIPRPDTATRAPPIGVCLGARRILQEREYRGDPTMYRRFGQPELREDRIDVLLHSGA